MPAFKSLISGKLNRIYQKAMPGAVDGVLLMLGIGRRWKNQGKDWEKLVAVSNQRSEGQV